MCRLASYDDLILNAEQAAFIGRDPRDGGASAAKAVLAAVPKGNYVLIGGDPGQTGSTQMQQGYHDVLAEPVAKGDVKIVMDQFTPQWKTEPAQANAENALTQNDNKVDAFLVSYDGMSLGVLQAIDAAGVKAGSIPVTGQDMELAGGTGDRRGPHVRQRLAGARRDGGARRGGRGGNGAVQAVRHRHHDRQWRRADSLGEDADLPGRCRRHGEVRLLARTLAEDRRGVQERAGPQADLLSQSSRAARTVTRADGDPVLSARGIRKRFPGVTAVDASIWMYGRVRSWPCSARMAPASRP